MPHVTTPKLLALLGALMLLIVLVTPEEVESGGGLSSFSAGSGGARVMFELAQRMGWRASRRTTTLDSAWSQRSQRSQAGVQAVIGAQTLGAAETHRLLEQVRRGGGLVFSMDGGGEEIADSLGLALGDDAYLLPGRDAGECSVERRRRERPAGILPPMVHAILWRRPPPGTVTALLESRIKTQTMPTVAGFPLGAGRVVAASTSELFTNESMRICAWGADVAVARALEYVRPARTVAPEIAFDEFHHGYGAHPGSMTAVTMYLSRTASGHFLAQALVAGLLLLIAAAPRPVVPRDPERIVRRSPLEHADALALAYMDVGASRTAASRLISGLRRRLSRGAAAEGDAGDAAFLDAIQRREPGLREPIEVLRRALRDPVTGRELIAVGEAVVQIEQALTTSPTTRA